LANQAQYTVDVQPSNATDPSVTWSIVKIDGDATVDQSGLVTAVAVGSVKVVATANDGSGVSGEKTITITVPPTPVQSITVNGADSLTT